jgi:hypothetical protein
VKTKPRAPLKIIRQIKRAIDIAEMTNAVFGFPSDMVSCDRQEPKNITPFIKDTTKLYRETWLLPPLYDILAWAEGSDPRID